MAKGLFYASGNISSNTSVDIGTVEATERIYVKYLTFMVETAGTTSRLLARSGTAGKFIARMATATADALLMINFAQERRMDGGCQLALGEQLRLTTSGAAAATVNYDICYEVK